MHTDASLGKCLLRWLSFGLLMLMVACGANNSSYKPTTDKVESRGKIRFDVANAKIIITEPGPLVSSALVMPCDISFEATELSYALISEKQLKLALDTFSYVKPIAKPAAVDGVAAGIFAVWQLPSKSIDGISYTIEVEVLADALIYRNTCTR